MAVTDVFDAVLEPRVYHEGMSGDGAVGAAAGQSNRYFDLMLAECFLRNVLGIRRARVAAESSVQQYNNVSGVTRLYGT